VLSYNRIDIQGLPIHQGHDIDYVFLWNGDARILLSIIKLVEDRKNTNKDIKAGIKAIILIENSVRFYSAFLPVLYTEIMKQSQFLIAESVNMAHRFLRMRARPKILLATNFEEGKKLYQKYKNHVLGIVSDIQFPRKDKTDTKAGIRFARMVKREFPDMPVLLQSSTDTYKETAQKMGASFLNKHSKSMLFDLSTFIENNLGFGDFKFRLPSGEIVGSAKDIHSLLELLKTVPGESLLYHGSRNHFSNWLMARTEFELAGKLRPVEVSEFKDADELRNYLTDIISDSLKSTEKGVVVDFNSRYFSERIPFTKIGYGSLGGKARGLAFFNSILRDSKFANKFQNAHITIPNSTVIATDIFDIFMSENNLYPMVCSNPDDKKLREKFLKAKLPEKLMENLKKYIKEIRCPISVRSSSIMEDSQSQPFAGIYETYMIPNNHVDENTRLQQLSNAIKLVYASTYSEKARAYLGSVSYLQDEEKMAVILQKLVGRTYQDRFYPDISGVAQSHNFYPVPPIKPQNGLSQVALGLGFTVVEGYKSFKFSPSYPKINFQFASTKDYFETSQKTFMALDMKHPDFIPTDTPTADILNLDLEYAMKDNTLQNIASTYSQDNDMFYEGTARTGPKVITFAPILKSDIFPMADIVEFMLNIGKRSMACEVEMEFAIDLASKTFY
ncbi:MAG TPA: PEP/pyruvate-binding domain-containing protein, partial [Elusimicrobiales bacterium]|nr:PEP/pyruvate-binding domain-containing protein [Elusimicrobiales bacterium]